MCGHAKVCDKAIVRGEAKVSGEVVVRDKAIVSGKAKLAGSNILVEATKFDGCTE